MIARTLAIACLCTAMFHGAGFAGPPAKAVEGVSVDYSMVVSGLPWKFDQSAVAIDDPETRAGTFTRYQFVSTEPLGKTTQQKTYLRADLNVTAYTSHELATESLMLIRGKADPDMGLSYAWDYLLLDNSTLYHLHTGCIMSEDNFDIMVNNLRQAVLQEADSQPQALRCRCGGGCRISS